MLCGTMSCLRDQTLWCEAIQRAEQSDCLGSGMKLSLYYCGLGDEPLVVGVTSSLYGQRIMAWSLVSRQICAVPDLCCIVSRRLVELVGGVFDPWLSSAIAVFEHVKDELAVIPCLLLATL